MLATFFKLLYDILKEKFSVLQNSHGGERGHRKESWIKIKIFVFQIRIHIGKICADSRRNRNQEARNKDHAYQYEAYSEHDEQRFQETDRKGTLSYLIKSAKKFFL